MKRWMGLLLSGLLCLSLLSGCGGGTTPDDPHAGGDHPPVVDEDSFESRLAAIEEGLDAAAPKLKVHFFSSEVDNWGDCTYLELPNGENLLIDTGMPAAAAGFVDELLDAGVDRINHLIISHSHADHVRGLSNFLANMKIDHAYSTDYWTTDFAWVVRDLKSMGASHTKIVRGDTLDMGPVHIDVIYPTADMVQEQPGVPASGTDGPGGTVNINSHSMIMKLTYGNFSILFTGDSYIASQNDCIQLNADHPELLEATILKVPHHGYDNAGNAAFIQAVSPEYAVAMGNHTMTDRLYSYYTKVGCTTYLTWMNGSVYVVSDGSTYNIVAENPEILDYYKK